MSTSSLQQSALCVSKFIKSWTSWNLYSRLSPSRL